MGAGLCVYGFAGRQYTNNSVRDYIRKKRDWKPFVSLIHTIENAESLPSISEHYGCVDRNLRWERDSPFSVVRSDRSFSLHNLSSSSIYLIFSLTPDYIPSYLLKSVIIIFSSLFSPFLCPWKNERSSSDIREYNKWTRRHIILGGG